MPRVSPPVAAGRGAWSDAAIERLKALWSDDGLSATVIAGRLGVSRNAVLGKVHRLGLSNRRVGARAAYPPRPPKRPRAPRRVSPPKPPAARRAMIVVGEGPHDGLVERLEQLGPHTCHWPIGDPAVAGFAFCGRAAGARVYCDPHWAVAHVR